MNAEAAVLLIVKTRSLACSSLLILVSLHYLQVVADFAACFSHIAEVQTSWY